MVASRRTEPTPDMSSFFSPEPTLEEFTELLTEPQTNGKANGHGKPVPEEPETASAIEDPRHRKPELGSPHRDIRQVVTALTGLKSELKRAGLLEKPNVQNLFRQVAEFAATQPKGAEASSSSTATKELRYQRKQLLAVASQMRQTSDLESLLRFVVKMVRETLQVDRAMIYRIETDDTGKVVAESLQRGWTPALGENSALACLCFDQTEDFVKQQAIAVEDINRVDLTPYQHQLLDKFQVKASLSLPIVVAGQTWGLLIAQQCSGARNWQESELNLLYQLCLELTINLQQSEFLTRLNQQDDREKAVSKMVDRIRRSLDISTIFRTTTQEVRQMLRVDRVMVYRFNPDWSGEIVAESVASGWTSLLQEQFNNPALQDNISDCNLKTLGSSLQTTDTYLQETRGGVYAKGETARVVNDIYQAGFSPCYIDSLEQFQARAYVIVPIVQDRKLWGLLAAYQNSAPRNWDKAEAVLMTQLGTQLGVALQQAENLQQVKNQTKQLAKVAERERAVSSVIEKIRTTLDIDTIFKTATQEVRQLLQTDRVGIYRFEQDWSGGFVAESVTVGWTSLLQEREDDSGFTDKASDCSVKNLGSHSPNTIDTYLRDTQGGNYVKGTRFRVVNDVYKAGFSACYLSVLERYQAKAYVIVPILQNNKLWGLLAAYQNSSSREWEEAEVSLLTQIGAQLGVALQQAEYLRQVQEQTEQLAKIAEREKNFVRVIDQVSKSVIEKIRLSQDVETVFGQVTQQIRQLLQADRVSVYRFNGDWGGEYIAESVASGWTKLVGSDLKTIWEDTHLQETQGGRYRNNETFAVNDIYQVGHQPCHIEILEQFQVKAYVVVPIFKGQQLWGLLAAYQNARSRQWEESEVNLLAQLGAQLGVALQQSEFLAQIQRQSERERTLARVSDRIRQSLDFSRQSLDINTIFQVTVQDIRQLMKVDRAAVYRFSPDWSGSFISESVNSGWSKLVGTEIGTNVQDTYLRENQGGRYRNRESLAVDDIYKAGHDPCHVELLEKFEARAYILVPIMVEQRLWGILAVYQNSEPRHWEDADVTLLNQLATQLGVALEQVDSLEQVRTQSEQLTKAAAREKAAKEQLQQRVIQLLAAVQPVFSGDLTVRVPITEDEVGTIADAYNNTIQSLRKIVSQVQTAAVKVAQTSRSSGGAIGKLSHQAEEQLQEVTRALDQIQTMIASTQAVAANAHQVEIAVQQANQTVRAGDAAMNRTVDGISAIRETVAETSKKIKRLSESSQKISKVVSLISNFTTQTQLLALNASIEATRAGEYGRGFSVVADEVRSLARQSADATREVEKLVQEIQAETGAVATAMDIGIQQVVGGTSLVGETRQQLNEIVTATAKISQLVQGITQATQTQTQQSQLVTQAMTDVATLANKNTAQSSQLSTSFQELMTTAQQLQTSVGQFKLS